MADFPNLSRRGFLNRSAAVGGLLVVPGLLSACSKTDAGSADGAGALEALRKQGFVRVAYANEAPYGYMEGKQLKGEAPTLHREIFKALGVDELKPTLSEWDGLIPGLQAGKYDVVSAGMAITPERCANAIFSEPEFISPTALMVKKGNPKKVTDLASAKAAGIVVGVMSGAVEGSYAEGAASPRTGSSRCRSRRTAPTRSRAAGSTRSCSPESRCAGWRRPTPAPRSPRPFCRSSTASGSTAPAAPSSARATRICGTPSTAS